MDINGLMTMGVGAIIKRMPSFNVLISSFSIEPVVAPVHKCTKHLEKEGKKDAEYITGIFLPRMRKLDVQTAGQIVNAHFPGLQPFMALNMWLVLCFLTLLESQR